MEFSELLGLTVFTHRCRTHETVGCASGETKYHPDEEHMKQWGV